MGFWRAAGEWLGLVDPVGATFADADVPATRVLDQLVLDFMGRGNGRVTRAEALSVSAVKRGRNLLCSVSTLPLVTRGPDQRAYRSPFLSQIDPDVPNVVTLAQTIEDLVFDAVAWWRVTGFGWDGYPANARRLDPSTVSLDAPAGRSPAPLPHGLDPRGRVVYVDGRPVSAREIIRFDSPNPGILNGAGSRAIRRAILLDQAAAMYADDPRPLDFFTPADGALDPADDDDVREILREWRRARKTRGTAYVPAALRYNSVDSPSPADLQLVELQRQVTLDIANELGLDPEDLGVSTTSRTYANATDRRRDRINDVLSPYISALTDRLSMHDVCKRGYRVDVDLDEYMRADPATRWNVYQTANAIRDENGRPAITVAEIRREERMTPLPDTAPAPAATPAAPPAPAVDPDAVIDTVDARGDQVATFDGVAGMTFDATVVGFAVDLDKRTVRGTIVPYGRVGWKMGRQFVFARGALQYGDVGRVKLLRDHDTRQPLGLAVRLTDGPTGTDGVFRVSAGADRDEALLLAADGVLDGMSVGVDFTPDDTERDPNDPTVTIIKRATLREVSLTAVPAFDDARVTSVAASRTQGDTTMPCSICGQMHADGVACPAPAAPAAPAATPTATVPPALPDGFNADQLGAAFAAFIAGQGSAPGVVDPAGPGRPPAAVVNEAAPYRFDRGGNFIPDQPHVFSADLHQMALDRDQYGRNTDAGRRVMALLSATFATTTTAIDELTPATQRPDMYVDQRDYRTPLWDMIGKGAPPDGVRPFIFPKFNTASGLVADHAEGVEPDAGIFTTTNQTVTPSALSGKASITREVWDMGGNPAVSGLIFNQMKRGYREGLESAAATFLNTLVAAADIAIAAGATDETLAAAWDAALVDLQFIRGYDFSAFALEKALYKAFAAARDTTGRALYPIIGASNANGTAASRFRTLDLAGVTGVPSWALPSTTGAPNNSWLFDPATVFGWASTPQRLEFPGTDAAGEYAPTAMIDIAIWGYKAFANSDIGGVRQVIYDAVA